MVFFKVCRSLCLFVSNVQYKTQNLNTHVTESTFRLHVKTSSMMVLKELLAVDCSNHIKHIYTVWAKCSVFGSKLCGISTNHSSLEGQHFITRVNIFVFRKLVSNTSNVHPPKQRVEPFVKFAIQSS